MTRRMNTKPSEQDVTRHSSRRIWARTLAAKSLALASMATITASQAGCLGLASQLMHVAGMDMIPAEYDELKDSKVAIVTVTDSSQYTNDVAARQLSRRVGGVLTTKVKNVELIREDLIEQYRDVNGYDSLDYQAIGKEVGAEKVLAIELTDLQLRDGMTLFRGRSDVYVQVIDVSTGNTVYRRTMDQYTFPKSTGQHSSETTEDRFRKLYLQMLANEIGRLFHPFDGADRIALDSKIASQ